MHVNEPSKHQNSDFRNLFLASRTPPVLMDGRYDAVSNTGIFLLCDIGMQAFAKSKHVDVEPLYF